MMQVSRAIVSFAALVLTTEIAQAAYLDMERLGRTLGGWRKKGGSAAEYKSADSNYRTYKPTVSPHDGGIYVSTKIDHIRGFGKDDHAFLELTFDAEGTLASARTQMTIGGAKLDTKWVTVSAGAINPTMGAVAYVGGQIFQGLRTFVSELNEHGGRANFPAVVRHNINEISYAVRP